MRLILLLLITFHLFAAERIVTLSPAIAEITAALNGEASIVGVSDYTLYPASLEKRPKIGGYTTLSLEKVLALRPTLVIGLAHQQKFLHQLEHFKIKTITLELETIEEIEGSIVRLGERLKQDAKAQSLIEAIEAAKATTRHSDKRPKVLIVFASSSGLSRGVYVAGHDLFFEEILHICGAENAYSDNYALQPILSVENIIATDPDEVLLLLGPKDSVDVAALKQAWQALPIRAAKAHAIHVIQNDYILIPSHRIAKSIKTICQVIAW